MSGNSKVSQPSEQALKDLTKEAGRADDAPPATRGRMDLASLIAEYENQILPEWTKFLSDFEKRAKGVVEAAAARVEAIRLNASRSESEIRERYDRPAPNPDLGIEPLTIVEAMRQARFQEHWWKVGLGGLILGWILISFGFGVIAGVGTITGFAFWVQKQRQDIVDARLNQLAEEQELHALDQQTAAEKRTELAGLKDSQVDEHEARYSDEKRPLIDEWAMRCAEFNQGLNEFEARLRDVLESAGSRFAPFSDDEPLHEQIDDLDEQLAFRLGERTAMAPRKLDKELSYELALSDRPASLAIHFPVFYELSQRRTLLIEGGAAPSSSASPNIFENVMTRILRQLPPGKATFTLIDPLGLGKNFAPFLKLQDFSEALINGTVWTNRDQIKRRLGLMIEHIEKVTQKYLRADYEDIESYNRQAQDIAEPYRFICIADFPESFDEDAVRDLVKIVQNGPRCGVHTLIYRNENVNPAYGINLNELLQSCVVISGTEGHGLQRQLAVPGGSSFDLTVDSGQETAQVKKLVDSFGAGAVDAMKVEVPFSALFGLAKLGDDRWTEQSIDSISVPLGPIGAKKALMMTLNSRLSHNALIVGRPGSGKSNLLHVFISMVCQRYSPDEVELYLVDFKKGVEFKDYANSLLPHARVIAVESEREFGLSVLKALDKEMTVRAELFKLADAAENIGEYRKRKPDARMPRAVLIVDEFQEFFTREDKIKSEATLLFDRLVRQGRSFGIHVILGTQSLASSGLPRSTIDQIPIRIALQCSEADSRQILADDNIVARGLSRPGEAIYNDKAGLIEGNNQFQVAMFGGSERKAQLASLMAFLGESGWQGDPPRIFEGHESALLVTCKPLMTFTPVAASASLKTWLGEPVSLDEPVFASFPPQAGRNMMVISREEEQGTNVILAALTSLVAQLPPRDLTVHIVDLTTADATWADFPESLREAMPHRIEVSGRHRMRDLLPELRDLIRERQSASNANSDTRKDFGPRTVLAIIGAHRARELRPNDDVGAFAGFDARSADSAPDLASCLKEIVTDGPDVGVHTMLWLDSYANFERIFDRRVLGEFGIRVSGALPEKDSHTLYDSQIAAQISHPNRMVKFDEDLVGVYTMFRPYAVTSEAAFEQLHDRMFAGVAREIENV
jgi:DNA segregation ATPase FtsK/SpoIIIE, S-DNA-T family